MENLCEQLYSLQLKIAYVEWENFIQLLPSVLPVYHEFYKKLPHEQKYIKKKSTVEIDEDAELDLYYDNT